MAFYDREDELAALEEAWSTDRAQWFIVWGRRRVGKTQLLARLLEGRRGFMFEAQEGSRLDQLEDFSRELATSTGRRSLLEQPYTTWEGALAGVEEFAASERAIIVIDEYQRVKRSAPEVGSVLNRWWRQQGRESKVMLVLAGSEVSFFQRDVLAQPATEYGRRTGQLQIAPFDYLAAGLFFPEWTAENRLRAYAVCGGMPYYLEQFDPGKSLDANVLHSVLWRSGVLYEEARALLYQELPDPSAHFSVLRAVAGGANRVNEIVSRTGLDQRTVLRTLDALRDLFLLERMTPVTEPDPHRSKRTFYAICDPYLAFWFRFVHPYLSRLETRASAAQHLVETVLPELDHFVSATVFEGAAATYVLRAERAAAAGRWWGMVRAGASGHSEQREVDVVAVDARQNVVALGTCKWTQAPMDDREDALLTQLEAHIPRVTERPRHYLFSRSGFTERLRRIAEADPERYRLVSPEELYRPAG